MILKAVRLAATVEGGQSNSGQTLIRETFGRRPPELRPKVGDGMKG